MSAISNCRAPTCGAKLMTEFHAALVENQITPLIFSITRINRLVFFTKNVSLYMAEWYRARRASCGADSIPRLVQKR